MKFSHILVFNAKSEWRKHYIDYDSLKSTVYRFGAGKLDNTPPLQAGHRSDEAADLESPAVVESEANASPSFDDTFVKLLDSELSKIRSFFLEKEAELTSNTNVLFDEIAKIESSAVFGSDAEGDGNSEGETDSDGQDESGAQKASMARRSRFIRDAIVSIFSDPKKYNQASRGRTKRGISARHASVADSTDGSRSQSKRKDVMGRRGGAMSERGTSKFLEPDEAQGRLRKPGEDDSGGLEGRKKADVLARGDGYAAEESRTSLLRSSGRSKSTSDYGDGCASSKTAPPKPTRSLRQLGSSGKESQRSAQPGLFRSSTGPLDAGELRQDGHSEKKGGKAAIWDGLSGSPYMEDQRVIAGRSIRELYSNFCSLRNYINLNHTGMQNIIQKYDKITGKHLHESYLKTIVEASPPFLPQDKLRLQLQIERLTSLYARVVTGGDLEEASRQLEGHLREYVVWERNSIWREAVAMEKRGGRREAGGTHTRTNSEHDVASQSDVKRPSRRFGLPQWINRSCVFGIVAVAFFVGLLNAPWFGRSEERNALALVVFVIIMWAAEVVPFFVTSMLVPLLVVSLRVPRSTDGEDRRLTAPEATKYIVSQMFNPTIMLLLGGFTIAAALSKHAIDRILATKVMRLAGRKPRNVLLANMLIAGFASMWITNVAAPTLCLQLMRPVTRTQSSKATFSRSLIMGIALASNVGGMASPISSPQNIIALGYMDVPLSWPQWFAVALPVATVSIFLIWLWLMWSFAPGSGPDKGGRIPHIRPSGEPFNRTQWFVSIVTVAVIVLWCVEHQIEGFVGDMGIISLVPMVLFFGTGVLSKDDFDSYPWSIVMLAMGGIALGKAALSSGLLGDVGYLLQNWVQGLGLWPILAIFSVTSLIIATFLPHTVASVLIVPVAAQVGKALDHPHPRLLIMATALICSSGMGLPISGFPNLQAINAVDELGQRYLSVGDFLRNGVPSSLLALAVVVTIGYALMLAIGL